MLSLLPLLLTVTVGSPSAAPSKTFALLESPTRHVRTTDRGVQRLLADGISRSPTFSALMSHLNATDVIVYIEPVQTLPKTLAGRLLLMPMAGQQRYLRIQIAIMNPSTDTIALIAHELRHAVEVADAPDVRNETALVKLYERIGRPSGIQHCYETDAAQTAGQIVRKELLA
jgi:hypothetical protein